MCSIYAKYYTHYLRVVQYLCVVPVCNVIHIFLYSAVFLISVCGIYAQYLPAIYMCNVLAQFLCAVSARNIIRVFSPHSIFLQYLCALFAHSIIVYYFCAALLCNYQYKTKSIARLAGYKEILQKKQQFKNKKQPFAQAMLTNGCSF